ncbi:MAG: SDR family NAD(P)-dependent oxidoreductase [Syntrophothermus sp.]
MASEAPAASFAPAERGTRLRDRVAIVTGGGRGIGRAIALGLAAEGARVAVLSRTREELDAVVAGARELGADGLPLVVDCMDGQALKRAVEDAHERFGRLDILVNNVGGLVGDVEKLAPLVHDDDLFEQNVFLNLTTAYYASRAALPHMVDGGYGRIVNIGSGYATHGGGTIAYSAAKHGIVGLTRSLAYQVPAEVTVNCLCPGWTETALLDWAGSGAAEAARAKAAAQTVQGRVLAPVELAPMATLLAGPEGAGITGQVISVDGGYKV